MKKEKKIVKIAKQLAELEENITLGKNVQSARQKIEEISSTLTFEEMLLIDDYIMTKLFKKNY